MDKITRSLSFPKDSWACLRWRSWHHRWQGQFPFGSLIFFSHSIYTSISHYVSLFMNTVLHYYPLWSLFLHCPSSSLFHSRIPSKVTSSIIALMIAFILNPVSIFVISSKRFVIMRRSFLTSILLLVNFIYHSFCLSPTCYQSFPICFNAINFHPHFHLLPFISQKDALLTHFQMNKRFPWKLPSYFLSKILNFHPTFLMLLNFRINCVWLFFCTLMRRDVYFCYLKSCLSIWHYFFSFFVNKSVTFSFFIACYMVRIYVIVYFNSCLMDVDFDFISGWECPCLLSNFIWDESHPGFTLNLWHFMFLCDLMNFEFGFCN